MTFSRYTEKSGPLFKSLKLLNIFELTAYLTAVFMYSHHHGKLKALLDNLLKTNKSVHSYNTRSAGNIHIELKKTNYSKYSIGFKGKIIWNDLPSNTRNISSHSMFKKKVKEYVIKQLLDEVEHDIMNYQNRGLCYLPKPKAEADNYRHEVLIIHNIMRKPTSITVLLYIF